jgi:RimJ/RimL family protein N-acetyltransferase
MSPDFPDEPLEIAAGPFQLRPWEHRLAPELLTVLGPGADLLHAHAWIDERLARWTSGRGCHFAVQEITTAKLVGSVGLKGFTESSGAAEICFWTMPDSQRQGVASAAVATVTRWGFGGLGLRRIWLRHAFSDLGSCAVARRCGYRVDPGRSDMETHTRLATDPEPSRD